MILQKRINQNGQETLEAKPIIPLRHAILRTIASIKRTESTLENSIERVPIEVKYAGRELAEQSGGLQKTPTKSGLHYRLSCDTKPALPVLNWRKTTTNWSMTLQRSASQQGMDLLELKENGGT